MSETTDEVQKSRNYLRRRVRELIAERDALAAQLTEVTRKRTGAERVGLVLEIQKALGVEPKGDTFERIAELRAAEAALAPLRAVVEAAKAVPFSIDRCTLYGPADAAREKVEALRRALLVRRKELLDALFPAPTPR